MNQWTVAEWKDLIEWSVLMLVVGFALVLWLLGMHRAAAVSEPAELKDEAFDAACDAVGEALGDAWDCTRTWSAWGVGTMSPNDFRSVADDPERVAEITRAAVDAYRATTAKGAAR